MNKFGVRATEVRADPVFCKLVYNRECRDCNAGCRHRAAPYNGNDERNEDNSSECGAKMDEELRLRFNQDSTKIQPR